MKPSVSRLGVAVTLGVLAVAALVGAWVFVPTLLYPNLDAGQISQIPDALSRVQSQQAQGALQNSVRSTLLQGAAGLLVVIGAVAAWQQVKVGREGQVTGQLAHAIDQIGSDNPDVRVGGIYTLERIARNSPEDRLSVMFMLAVFVRRQAPWAVPATGGAVGSTGIVDLSLPWLRIRQPEVQAAMHVLSRRRIDPMAARLYLARTDLRSVQINEGGQLTNSNFNHANLVRAWLQGVRLDRSGLKRCDLRQANLRQASLVAVDLREANLQGADLRRADLRAANLRAADLRGAQLAGARLDDADLDGVRADETTVWPEGFQPTRGRLHYDVTERPLQ